jgi:hypothetical protein
MSKRVHLTSLRYHVKIIAQHENAIPIANSSATVHEAKRGSADHYNTWSGDVQNTLLRNAGFINTGQFIVTRDSASDEALPGAAFRAGALMDGGTDQRLRANSIIFGSWQIDVAVGTSPSDVATASTSWSRGGRGTFPLEATFTIGASNKEFSTGDTSSKESHGEKKVDPHVFIRCVVLQVKRSMGKNFN